MAGDIRADHLGSLLRPQALLDAQAARRAGRLDAEGLRSGEDAAILEALALQREVGVDVFSDGEYRRSSFMSNLTDAVEGFVAAAAGPGAYEWRGGEPGSADTPLLVVGAALRQTGRLSAHEAAFLQQQAPGTFKITVPSPNQFVYRRYQPGLTDRFYATPGDLLRDLTDIVRGELRALVDGGVRYVQIDAPSYCHLADERLVASLRARGVDPDAALTDAMAADNACLDAAAGRGAIVALHLCRGNSRSRWLSSGGYEPIAERLFQGLRVDRLLLEYDSERAGGFEPLRFVPAGRTVVLGLVTTKTGELEPQDLLRRRIEEASRYVPVERLALSPQCGFASSGLGNLLSWDEQRRKLELVVDTARQVWG